MVVLCYFTWVLPVFTPHSSITIMRIVVRMGIAAAAVQKSLLSSKTVQMTQKYWTTSRTKCTAAGVGVCNWEGMKRGHFYWYICLVIVCGWDSDPDSWEHFHEYLKTNWLQYLKIPFFHTDSLNEFVELHSAPPGFRDILRSSLTVVPQSSKFSHARFTGHTYNMASAS